MALQAPAKYQSQPAVKTATDRALDCLSKIQDAAGGFDSWGKKNSESCVQVIVALCELDISPDDPRFVKNGNSLPDNLFTYRLSNGSFRHVAGGVSHLMATEQGFYAMVARAAKLCGMNTEMEDDEILNTLAQFGDYVSAGAWARESLASCYREWILDQADLNVEPHRVILRCEIAQMVYNLLGCAELL